MSDITKALERIARDGNQSSNELLELVYQELRQLARSKLAKEAPGQTLQATALVHEAYIRLLPGSGSNADPHWENRGHFFAAAAEAMRRIIVDAARKKKALKRGGELNRVELVDLPGTKNLSPEKMLILNEAIDELASDDSVNAVLVKLKMFAGLSTDEIALALKIPRASAFRKWNYCRARLVDLLE